MQLQKSTLFTKFRYWKTPQFLNATAFAIAVAVSASGYDGPNAELTPRIKNPDKAQATQLRPASNGCGSKQHCLTPTSSGTQQQAAAAAAAKEAAKQPPTTTRPPDPLKLSDIKKRR